MYDLSLWSILMKPTSTEYILLCSADRINWYAYDFFIWNEGSVQSLSMSRAQGRRHSPSAAAKLGLISCL